MLYALFMAPSGDTRRQLSSIRHPCYVSFHQYIGHSAMRVPLRIGRHIRKGEQSCHTLHEVLGRPQYAEVPYLSIEETTLQVHEEQLIP